MPIPDIDIHKDEHLGTAFSSDEELRALVQDVLDQVSPSDSRLARLDDAKIEYVYIPDLFRLIIEFERALQEDAEWSVSMSKPRLVISHCRIVDTNCIDKEIEVDLLFDNCRFESKTMLTLAVFHGDFVVSQCVFENRLLMSETRFLSRAVFSASVFIEGILGSGTRVHGEFVCMESQFIGDIWFNCAVFEDVVDFRYAKVFGALIFNDSEFRKQLSLGSSPLAGCMEPSGRLRILGAHFYPGATIEIAEEQLCAELGLLEWISRNNSTSMLEWACEYLLVVFTPVMKYFGFGVVGRFVLGEDEPSHTSEQRQQLAHAASDYAKLRDLLSSQAGSDQLEDFCAWKHRELLRRSREPEQYPQRIFQVVQQFFEWAVLKVCLGYLLRPGRVLVSSLLCIVFFMCVYQYFAGSNTVAFNGNLPSGYTAESLWLSDDAGWSSSLFFSITTFVTLGYGDFAPLGWFKLVTGIEALLGVTLLALFTVAWGRKMIR